MATCDKCKGTGHIEDGAAKPRRRLPKNFGDTAYLLLKSDIVEGKPEWEKFLRSLTKYGELTLPQSKFFAVIHKEVLGEWPDFRFEDLEPSDSRPLPRAASGGTTAPQDDGFNDNLPF